MIYYFLFINLLFINLIFINWSFIYSFVILEFVIYELVICWLLVLTLFICSPCLPRNISWRKFRICKVKRFWKSGKFQIKRFMTHESWGLHAFFLVSVLFILFPLFFANFLIRFFSIESLGTAKAAGAAEVIVIGREKELGMARGAPRAGPTMVSSGIFLYFLFDRIFILLIRIFSLRMNSAQQREQSTFLWGSSFLFRPSLRISDNIFGFFSIACKWCTMNVLSLFTQARDVPTTVTELKSRGLHQMEEKRNRISLVTEEGKKI